MPIYEYECLVCGNRRELLQRHNDMPLSVCPDCGGHMKKLISNTSFVLKGTGWYKTDYPSSKGDKAKNSDKADKAEKSEKSEKTGSAEKAADASSDKKPGKKAETKPEAAAKS